MGVEVKVEVFGFIGVYIGLYFYILRGLFCFLFMVFCKAGYYFFFSGSSVILMSYFFLLLV